MNPAQFRSSRLFRQKQIPAAPPSGRARGKTGLKLRSEEQFYKSFLLPDQFRKSFQSLRIVSITAGLFVFGLGSYVSGQKSQAPLSESLLSSDGFLRFPGQNPPNSSVLGIEIQKSEGGSWRKPLRTALGWVTQVVPASRIQSMEKIMGTAKGNSPQEIAFNNSLKKINASSFFPASFQYLSLRDNGFVAVYHLAGNSVPTAETLSSMSRVLTIGNWNGLWNGLQQQNPQMSKKFIGGIKFPKVSVDEKALNQLGLAVASFNEVGGVIHFKEQNQIAIPCVFSLGFRSSFEPGDGSGKSREVTYLVFSQVLRGRVEGTLEQSTQSLLTRTLNQAVTQALQTLGRSQYPSPQPGRYLLYHLWRPFEASETPKGRTTMGPFSWKLPMYEGSKQFAPWKIQATHLPKSTGNTAEARLLRSMPVNSELTIEARRSTPYLSLPKEKGQLVATGSSVRVDLVHVTAEQALTLAQAQAITFVFSKRSGGVPVTFAKPDPTLRYTIKPKTLQALGMKQWSIQSEQYADVFSGTKNVYRTGILLRSNDKKSFLAIGMRWELPLSEGNQMEYFLDTVFEGIETVK